jgi:glycosyltransferase involved in cell wall biosynthesis
MTSGEPGSENEILPTDKKITIGRGQAVHARTKMASDYWRHKEAIVGFSQANKYDLLHDNGLWLLKNLSCWRAAIELGLPYILSTRGMLEPWSLGHKQWKKRLARYLYQDRILASVSMFHATSMDEAKNIRRLGFSQPIAVIPNGIDLPTSFGSSQSSNRPNKIALFLSRVHPKKGLINLLTAWRVANPQGWQLIIAGPDDGGHWQEVHDTIQRHNLSAVVKLREAAIGTEKDELFASADLFILPSFSENFGIVIAEAMAHGLPVITTTGTPWKSLIEFRAGWWVDPDVQSLTKAISEATNSSTDELQEMGRRGLALSANYTWPRLANNMILAYQYILGRGVKEKSIFPFG